MDDSERQSMVVMGQVGLDGYRAAAEALAQIIQALSNLNSRQSSSYRQSLRPKALRHSVTKLTWDHSDPVPD